MKLADYKPRHNLIIRHTDVAAPRFPVFDVHNHLEGFVGDKFERDLVPEIIESLDQVNVHTYVDLDGGWGEDILTSHLDILNSAAPGRFLSFGGVDWDAWEKKGNKFPDWAASRLRVQSGWGAAGLKIWKGFGLSVKDDQGKLVGVDDKRLDPIWQTAGELNMPVLVHVADPVAFFDPLDAYNERWDELCNHPDWHFPSPPYPPFQEIVNAMARVVERHPQTTFIGAHVGWYSENLGWVGALLERCPNFFVDIGARISELGRQPYSAQKFFLQYQDRILFGTDAGPDPVTYRIYYRFLETQDEYFNYNAGEVPYQGRWQIYGLNLPDEVLEKVYYQNAQRIFANR